MYNSYQFNNQPRENINASEIFLLIIFANLQQKMCLLNDQFTIILSSILPKPLHSYIPQIIRIILLFFKKNQIINPEIFKKNSCIKQKKQIIEESSKQTTPENKTKDITDQKKEKALREVLESK